MSTVHTFIFFHFPVGLLSFTLFFPNKKVTYKSKTRKEYVKIRIQKQMPSWYCIRTQLCWYMGFWSSLNKKYQISNFKLFCYIYWKVFFFIIKYVFICLTIIWFYDFFMSKSGSLKCFSLLGLFNWNPGWPNKQL